MFLLFYSSARHLLRSQKITDHIVIILGLFQTSEMSALVESHPLDLWYLLYERLDRLVLSRIVQPVHIQGGLSDLVDYLNDLTRLDSPSNSKFVRTIPGQTT